MAHTNKSNLKEENIAENTIKICAVLSLRLSNKFSLRERLLFVLAFVAESVSSVCMLVFFLDLKLNLASDLHFCIKCYHLGISKY